jgi:hypothetical protein
MAYNHPNAHASIPPTPSQIPSGHHPLIQAFVAMVENPSSSHNPSYPLHLTTSTLKIHTPLHNNNPSLNPPITHNYTILKH